MCVLFAVAVLAVGGGPFWPPYFLLIWVIPGGAVLGLLSVAKLRRFRGLPVFPRKSMSASKHDATDSDSHHPIKRTS